MPALSKERTRQTNKAAARRYRAKIWSDDPAKHRLIRKRAFLKSKYGITLQQFADMISEQQGRCAICNEEPDHRGFSVDHCHKTNKVRGLLCRFCNPALGYMFDKPERLRRAAEYLEKHASVI